MLAGRAVETSSRRDRTSFSGLGDLTLQVSRPFAPLFRLNSSRKVATRVLHTVICDQDGPCRTRTAQPRSRWTLSGIFQAMAMLMFDNMFTDSLKLRRSHRHKTVTNLEFVPPNKPGSARPFTSFLPVVQPRSVMTKALDC